MVDRCHAAKTATTFRTFDYIKKLCKKERLDEAIGGLEIMEQMGVPISRNKMHWLLQACKERKDHGLCRRVQSIMVRNGLDQGSHLADSLIRYYSFCECLVGAIEAFNKVIQPSMYTWSAIFQAYAMLEESNLAVELCHSMELKGTKIDKHLYAALIKACKGSPIMQARLIHGLIIQDEMQLDVVLGSTLIDTYAKFGCLNEACKIFEKLPNRNVVAWGVLIAGCAQNGAGLLTLEYFRKMSEDVINPDSVVLSNALRACAGIGLIESGRLIHEQIIKDSDISGVIANSLIDMYVKCESVEEACRVFYKLTILDIMSWNAIISGLARPGLSCLALEFFAEMQRQKAIKPDKVTFLIVLKACGCEKRLEDGRLIHVALIESEVALDDVLKTVLIDMYAKCDSLKEAHDAFESLSTRDVISWGAIIAGYAQDGDGLSALQLYEKMEREYTKPDGFIFASILNACGSIGCLGHGRMVHKQVLEDGHKLDLVLGNNLIHMYVKCGSLEEAHKVFNTFSKQDVVSWSLLISGYAEHGEGLVGLELFEEMQSCDVQPDEVTFLGSLRACTQIGALEQGRRIHGQIMGNGFMSKICIGNALIDMYIKCGSLYEACQVFDKLHQRDVVSWSTMVAGYASTENALLAMECFKKMEEEGVMPNEVTFAGILLALCRAGLVDEGLSYFNSMMNEHHITPDVQHLSCMVDLLGNSHFWNEAVNLLQRFDQPNVIGWTCLLSICNIYNNVEVARRCFEEIILLDPLCTPGYVLMANIYASAHKIDYESVR